MSDPDLYEVLGIEPTASVEQIKAAYRRRALYEHPDKNPGSEDSDERFKACSHAFEVLSHADRRADYDSQRLIQRGPSALVGDMMKDFLSGLGPRPKAGKDVHCRISISLKEASVGGRFSVKYRCEPPCDVCNGRGAREADLKQCEPCRGKGFARAGRLRLPAPCPHCGGKGSRIAKRCDGCDGVGRRDLEREVFVRLPPAVRNGHRLRVDGEGEPGEHGGTPGRLFVRVMIDEHALFKRNGRDLTLELPVSFATATLGGSVDVPTLNGSVRMRIPAGTQSGQQFRVARKGLGQDGDRGSLMVSVVVEVPTNVTSEQSKLVRELDQSFSAKQMPRAAEIANAVGERTSDG